MDRHEMRKPASITNIEIEIFMRRRQPCKVQCEEISGCFSGKYHQVGISHSIQEQKEGQCDWVTVRKGRRDVRWERGAAVTSRTALQLMASVLDFILCAVGNHWEA